MKNSADGGRAKTLAVLAGGRSRRMGRDKAFLPVGRGTLLEETIRPLAELFTEILIVVSPGQKIPVLPWRAVEDEVEGQGPLRGILTALRNSGNEACFILGCDMPGLSPRVVKKIIAEEGEADIAVAVGNRALPEPLLGVYQKSVSSEIERLLAGGERSILSLFKRVRTREVYFNDVEIPANINTPAEYRTLLERRIP